MGVMVYKQLDFKSGGITFQLEFKSPIVSIGGDSGSGKSYLYKALDSKSITGKLPNILCLNIKQKNLIDSIKNADHELIVIDNADLLLAQLDMELLEAIWGNPNNQYVIFSRMGSLFGIEPNNECELKQVDDVIYLEYTEPWPEGVEFS